MFCIDFLIILCYNVFRVKETINKTKINIKGENYVSQIFI